MFYLVLFVLGVAIGHFGLSPIVAYFKKEATVLVTPTSNTAATTAKK